MGINLITLTISDADGDKSPVSVYVHQDGLTTENDLIADYVRPLWDTIRPLITGQLISASISLDVDISTFTQNTVDVLADVQEKALFSFVPCGGFRAIRLQLPTANELIFSNAGAGSQVDRLNADVAAFSVLMTEEIGSGGISATDSHDNPLCRLEAAIQLFKG